MTINGKFPVDVSDVPKEMAEFLAQRGWRTWNSGKLYGHPDCKPVHWTADFSKQAEMQPARLFFPDDDEVSIFSIVFGHLIIGSRNTAVKELLDQNRG